MSVLTRPKTETRYHNMVRFHLTDDPELPEHPDQPLTLYISSLLSGENVSRIADFVRHINALPREINLQEEAYNAQQMLGSDLMAELRLGSLSPLTQTLNIFERMLRKENPFAVIADRIGYKVLSTMWYYGFEDRKNRRKEDCILHRLFINALYNLVYLYPRIGVLSEAWLFAILLARVNDNPDSCLENAQIAVSTMLYNACKYYNYSWSGGKPIIVPPTDKRLLGTLNQVRRDIREGYHDYQRPALMLHLILAPDTVPYEKPDIRSSVLIDIPTAGTNQTRTKLLPSHCIPFQLGTTDFYVPILDAISAHCTHVMLLPATKECYHFLCALYKLKPYDGITPLPPYFQTFYQAMYQPDMFVINCLLRNPLAEYDSGKIIFNKQASLTDYIPELPSSDSPQFMVNEFEVPRH